MRVIVCGSRGAQDRETVFSALDRMHAVHHFTLIATGAAAGVDTFAEQWARSREIDYRGYPARWRTGDCAGRHGEGPARNRRMLADVRPEMVIGFPGGRGTRNMCGLAHADGVDVITIGWGDYDDDTARGAGKERSDG